MSITFLPYQHNYLKYNNLTIWQKHPNSKREGNKGNFFPYPSIISFPTTARNDRTRDILENLGKEDARYFLSLNKVCFQKVADNHS
jgi:hypothetical protein